MRDICIRTDVSTDHHRKNLSIMETIQKDGVEAVAEKKFRYYVFEKSGLDADDQLKSLLGKEGASYQKKDRHIAIRKIYDAATGKGQMVYRVIGSFYIVQCLRIFAVVFMHTIKFDMNSVQLPPK